MHKTLLCDNSEFFRKALTGEFSESKTNTICLPEDDTQSFSVYCSWLYNETPFTSTAEVDLGADLPEDAPKDEAIVEAREAVNARESFACPSLPIRGEDHRP